MPYDPVMAWHSVSAARSIEAAEALSFHTDSAWWKWYREDQKRLAAEKENRDRFLATLPPEEYLG